MKLLLGATIALLLGALAVSWQGMKTGVGNTSASEIARLKSQVKEIQAEQDKLAIERQMLQLQREPVVTPTASSNASEIQQMKEQMERIRKLEEERERAKMVDAAEEGLLDTKKLEKGDSELRRARMISEALLMGSVKEYVEDPQYGPFITFDVRMPEQVQVGTIVAIRRKTGILGQLKVTQVEADGAVASPLPGFGPIQPQIGDELILPPQY
ncbi:MAG: hypothetical protein ABIQ96_09370 [Luteolibacter sp.]